jgi:hypothetical protein
LVIAKLGQLSNPRALEPNFIHQQKTCNELELNANAQIELQFNPKTTGKRFCDFQMSLK